MLKIQARHLKKWTLYQQSLQRSSAGRGTDYHIAPFRLPSVSTRTGNGYESSRSSAIHHMNGSNFVKCKYHACKAMHIAISFDVAYYARLKGYR